MKNTRYSLLIKNNKKNNTQLKDNKIIKLNKNFYSINNKTSNLKSSEYNKIFFDMINKIKKANYFNLNIKTKQNKELNKVKMISEKNKFINKHISNIKLIKIFLNGLKNLNNALVSNVKIKGLNSIIFSRRKSESEDNQRKLKRGINTKINLDLIKPTQEKILKLKKNLLVNTKFIEEEKNKESNLKRIIILDKNQTTPISNFIKNLTLSLKKKELIKNKEEQEKDQDKWKNRINNSANLSIERKENILVNESIDFVNLTNKRKSSIFLFLSKLKPQEKKKNLQNVESKSSLVNPSKEKSFKDNIRKYINSKISFNSKFVKLLATSNNFNFYKYNKNNNILRNNLYEFLHRSFISMFSLISKPVFISTPNKIIIQLFFLKIKKEIIKKNNTNSKLILENYNKLKIICNILTRLFKKPIELELVRLHYPYYNSNILVNLFGVYVNKIKLRRIINRFIGKAVKNQSSKNINSNKIQNYFSSEISGIKIKVAGRLLTQRVIPRKTVKIISSGSLATGKTMFLETSRFTNKNKRGAFSITISIGHNLRNS